MGLRVPGLDLQTRQTTFLGCVPLNCIGGLGNRKPPFHCVAADCVLRTGLAVEYHIPEIPVSEISCLLRLNDMGSF